MAIFGRDMLFDILYIADWSKIGDYRRLQIENNSCVDYVYKVGGKVLVQKDGILHKTESHYDSDPWTITSIHAHGKIRIER